MSRLNGLLARVMIVSNSLFDHNGCYDVIQWLQD